MFDYNPTIAIYKKYGTAQIDIIGNQCEFVVPRAETYSIDSIKPDVVQSTYVMDILRRDFTINTLRIAVKKYPQDPKFPVKVEDLTTQGIPDLQMKILRTPSDPD